MIEGKEEFSTTIDGHKVDKLIATKVNNLMVELSELIESENDSHDERNNKRSTVLIAAVNEIMGIAISSPRKFRLIMFENLVEMIEKKSKKAFRLSEFEERMHSLSKELEKEFKGTSLNDEELSEEINKRVNDVRENEFSDLKGLTVQAGVLKNGDN